jgi:hypothetical protein
MMRNVTIAAAALLAVGLSAGPASALGRDVCYMEEGNSSFLRLNVKLEGALSSTFERPKSVAYSVYGKTASPEQNIPPTVSAISGSVVVSSRSGANMELTSFGDFYGCRSSEASSTPQEWRCGLLIVVRNSTSLGDSIKLTRIDPRREELCRAPVNVIN